MGENSSKNKKHNDNVKIIYAFLIIIIILCGALFFVSVDDKPVNHYPPSSGSSKKQAIEHWQQNSLLNHDVTSKFDIGPQFEARPKLALIIDDIGFNKRYNDLIEINIPLTFAIIPFTRYSRDAALNAGTAGMEIMLHLPMEPQDYPKFDPGEGALLTSMNNETIQRLATDALDALPEIRGVNNHMGSKFTEYSEGMEIVLKEIKNRGLFFIDSKTSANSAGFSIAKIMKIKTAERSVFLDNVQTEKAIKKQLMEAIMVARKYGEAIAIGHPYPSTINVIRDIAALIEKEGVELVLASQIVK